MAYLVYAATNEFHVPAHLGARRILRMFNLNDMSFHLDRLHDNHERDIAIGFCFKDLSHLVHQMKQFEAGVSSFHIEKLIFDSHGTEGKVYINSVNGYLRSDTMSIFEPYLRYINAVMTPKSPQSEILFAGCNVGRGYIGSELLINLSRIFSHVKVTASSLVQSGDYHDMNTEVRRSDFRHLGWRSRRTLQHVLNRHERNMTHVIDFNDDSPYLKTAYNGEIIRYPLHESREMNDWDEFLDRLPTHR